MPTAELLLQRKQKHNGGELASLPVTATVLEAASLMNERRVGSVIVLHQDRLAGIFTERDILRRVVAAQLDPATTTLKEVMTERVACATPKTTLDELRHVMREQRIRHVPVLDEQKILGMISIGDLNRAEREVQEETIHYLSQFISVT